MPDLLPPGWSLAPLSTVITSVKGGFSVKCEDRAASACEPGVLKTGAVSYGIFDPEQNKLVDPTDLGRVRTPVSAGTIVFCRKNSEDIIGACALVNQDHPNLFLSDLLWELRPAPGVSLAWLEALMKSQLVAGIVRIKATGTQTSMKNISQDKLLSIAVPVPPPEHQRKIAAILETWDRADRAGTKQLAAKVRLFDSVARQLFTGHIRLPKYKAPWRTTTLTEATSEILSRNAGRLGPETVMGVNKTLGMIPMKDHVRADDLSRYKIVGADAFAYNPMRLNIGSIARNHHGRDVLVSPDYVAFATRPDMLHPGYFDHLRRSSLWSIFVKNAGSGGVRVRIYYDDLADFVFDLPPLDEQIAITEFLDTARREVSLIEQRRDALDRQKCGLMQKLLTGEWRVNGAEAAA